MKQVFKLTSGRVPIFAASAALVALSGCPLGLGQETCTDDEQCVAIYGSGAQCGVGGLCQVEGNGMPVADPGGGGVGVLVDGVSMTTVRTIGIAAQTGTTRDLGIGMTLGIQAAFAAWSKTGPVTLQHYPRDDGYVPDSAVALIEEVTQDAGARPDPEPGGGADSIEGREAFAVIGSMGSPTSLRMLPTVNDRGILFFGTYSGASHLYNDPPDEVVWQYRPRYEDEAYQLTTYLAERDPRALPPNNIFAFSQSPVMGDNCEFCNGSQGTAGRAAEASEDGQTVMDAYGFSGYRGIRRALQERGLSQVDIPLGTYRANSTDVEVPTRYFVEWVAGIADGAAVPDDGGSGPYEVGIVMVPVALPGAAFIESIIGEVKRLQAGDKPNSLTTEQWDGLDPAKKERLRELEVTFTSISPAGDAMPATLAAGNAAELCGTFDIVVSQVVPFPLGSSAAANAYREELAATFPNEPPGFVTFEGWAVGRIWGEVIQRTLDDSGEITRENVLKTMRAFANVDLGTGTTINWGANDHKGSDQIFATRIDETCTYQDFEFGLPAGP